MFKVRVYSLCGIGTADSLYAKAELWDMKPKFLCGSGTAKRQVAVYFLCGSGIADLKATQYFMCGSGTAELKVLVYS